MSTSNQVVYEINFRVWMNKLGEHKKINDIPINYFNDLADKGIEIIWLMGVWKTCPSIIKKCCFETDLIFAYNDALPDWKEKDVIGSPFAIDKYEIDPKYGNMEDLKKLKINLNKLGLKLFLDFIPNHFNADSSFVKSNPDFFLHADEEILTKDSHTYFKSDYHPHKIFAHGRDPLFPAWTDTIQVNYFSDEARNFMTGILLKLTDYCDGVRCDMAMLQLNNVFKNTWLGVVNKFQLQKPEEEFWQLAIKKVKAKKKDFIFLAEAYWDLEWELQQLGFDFTYDKRLIDRLLNHDISGVKNHLNAELAFQLKSVRFIENHDEKRAAAKFGKPASIAAAAVMSTIPGLKLYFEGQFDGKKVKLPVQLGREPNEKESKLIKNFYNKLLNITKENIFKNGEFNQLEILPSSNDNFTYENFFAWQWELKNERRIVIINFSEDPSQCRVKLEISSTKNEIVLYDLLKDAKYTRAVKEISNQGLYVELKSYSSHIFSFELPAK